MSDELLFQPTAFSKRGGHPGIFIFDTPTGHAVDTKVKIGFTAYGMNDNKEYYDITENVDVSFEYVLLGTTGRPKEIKINTNYGLPVMSKNNFSKLVDINEEGRRQQMLVVWPPASLETKGVISIQAVKLVFTMTDGSTVTSDHILCVKGDGKTKTKNYVKTRVNRFVDNMKENVSKIYDKVKDGDKSHVDLVELAEELVPYDTSNAETWRDRATFSHRERNPRSQSQKMEIIFPKYMVVVPNAPFFVLAKKDNSRVEYDYTLESFNIEPYSDRGFSAEALRFDGTYTTSTLPKINDTFLGKSFRDYYQKLNGDLEDYHIIRFVICPDVEDKLPSTVEMTLNFPFNNVFQANITISKDVKDLIKQIAVLDRDPKSIEKGITVDENDFQAGLEKEEEPYLFDYEDYELVKIDKKDDDNQVQMGDLDDDFEMDNVPVSPKNNDDKSGMQFEEDDDLEIDDDDDLNKLLADFEADNNNVPAPAPKNDVIDDDNMFGDLGFDELYKKDDDNSSFGSLDFEGYDDDDVPVPAPAPSQKYDAYEDEDEDL